MRTIWATGGMAGLRAAAVALALFATLRPAAAEPLRLGYESWVGPGPFFIAREKGWFEEEGIAVKLVNIEDVRVRASALATGEVDAITANIDEAILHLGAAGSPRFVFAIAESRGGDGLLAKAEIGSVAELKGRTVAVQPGSSRQFYLNTLLRAAGLAETDVTTMAMAPGEAGLAFERGEVDAAVTWQPWLGRAGLQEQGRVLADTTQSPGLLVEMVVTRAEVLDKRQAEFQALYRVWRRAVTWTAENPDEAAELMAAGLGRWLRHRDVVKDYSQGIAWYDGTMNREYFGTGLAPGPLANAIWAAIDLWSGLGKLPAGVRGKEMAVFTAVTAEE